MGQGRPAARLPPAGVRAAARATGALPLLLALSARTSCLVWPSVMAGGLICGHQAAAGRNSRPAATVTEPLGPAVALKPQGVAAIRLTGWPLLAGPDVWQAPAALLAFQPLTAGQSAGGPVPGEGLLVRAEGPAPDIGQVLVGRLALRVPGPAPLPGGFCDRTYLAGRGITWRAKIEGFAAESTPPPDPVARCGARLLAPVKQGIVRGLQAVLPPPEALLARSVLLGDRTPESRRDSAGFTELGLAHLFSVSGLHVGILLGIVLLPGRLLNLGPGLRTLPLLATMPMYIVLTGAPGSVLRAAGMSLLVLAAAPSGRKAPALHHLGLLYWLGILWAPDQAGDGGLRLSYLAGGGILAASAWTGGFKFGGPRLVRAAAAGLAVSLAAQWFTLPVMAASFGYLNLWSPLVNLVGVPLFGLAVWLTVLGVLGQAVWPPVGEALGAWAFVLLRTMRSFTSALAPAAGGAHVGLPVPGAGAWAAWLGLTALLHQVLRRRRRGQIGAGTAAAVIAASLAAGIAVFHWPGRDLHPRRAPAAWQFDVGQGDCAVIAFPDGWRCLIDTGGTFARAASVGDGPLARAIVPFLDRQGIRDLDAAVLTHAHLDHTGGVSQAAARLRVRKWYAGGASGESLARLAPAAAVTQAVAGMVLHRWRDWELVVVYPPADIPSHLHENDRSVVLALNRAGRAAMIWPGDLEQAGEDLLLRSGAFHDPAQVLKAGHHGSRTSGSPVFLQTLDPQLVVVSCGLGNRHRHPSHGPYCGRGDTIPALRTDLDGSLRLAWQRDGALSWTTSRGPRGTARPP